MYEKAKRDWEKSKNEARDREFTGGDPLSDIPLSQQFDIDSPIGTFDPNANFGTGRDGTFGSGTCGKGMPSNPDFRGAGNNKNTSSINTTKAGGPLSKYTPEQQDQIRKENIVTLELMSKLKVKKRNMWELVGIRVLNDGSHKFKLLGSKRL